MVSMRNGMLSVIIFLFSKHLKDIEIFKVWLSRFEKRELLFHHREECNPKRALEQGRGKTATSSAAREIPFLAN